MAKWATTRKVSGRVALWALGIIVLEFILFGGMGPCAFTGGLLGHVADRVDWVGAVAYPAFILCLMLLPLSFLLWALSAVVVRLRSV